jgi:hypothetical protein
MMMTLNEEIQRIALEIIEKERKWYYDENEKRGQKDIIKRIIDSGLKHLESLEDSNNDH